MEFLGFNNFIAHFFAILSFFFFIIFNVENHSNEFMLIYDWLIDWLQQIYSYKWKPNLYRITI